MKHISNYLLFLSVCILITFLVFACSNNEYKQIVIENQLGSYSLEYPSHYKKNIWDNLEFKVPYTHLIFEGPIKEERVEIFDPGTGKIKTVTGKTGTSDISVEISNYKTHYGRSYTGADFYNNLLVGEAKWANFQLLARSPITVSGVEGELIVYLVDRLMPIPVEDGENMWYVRIAYFDYNDLTWSVEMRCDQDIQEEQTVYFNHIIETFEILE